jgi:hypothetical protein
MLSALLGVILPFVERANKSLWPLLKKDGVGLQYLIILPFWAYLGYEGLPEHRLASVIHMVRPP